MNTKPNPFKAALETLTAQPLTPNLADPAAAEVLTSYSVLQQFSMLDQIESMASEHKVSPRLTKLLFSALSLVERTQARIARAREASTRRRIDTGRDSSLFHEACRFLETELAEQSRPAQEILILARSVGIAQRTLLRAKLALTIRSSMQIDRHGKRFWAWGLPTPPAQEHPPIDPDAPQSE